MIFCIRFESLAQTTGVTAGGGEEGEGGGEGVQLPQAMFINYLFMTSLLGKSCMRLESLAQTTGTTTGGGGGGGGGGAAAPGNASCFIIDNIIIQCCIFIVRNLINTCMHWYC